MTKPTVLIVAGVDSSGGAGLSADLRVIHAAGVAAKIAVTAVTAQTDQGVRHVEPTSVQSFRAQLEAAGQVKAVKVGMLATSAHVQELHKWLAKQAPAPSVVLDPVVFSSSGGRLLSEEGVAALWGLLPMLSLITPNGAEAKLLADSAPVPAWAQAMPCGVLITGGDDAQDPITDVLYIHEDEVLYEHPRVAGSFRGTGCMLSTGVAAALSQGLEVEAAVGASVEGLLGYLSRVTP